MIQGSGYDPTLLVIDETGTRTRIRTSSTRLCCAPLAPIENAAGLKIDLLRHRQNLVYLFTLWDSPFSDLLTRSLPRNPTRVISRTFLPSDMRELEKITTATTENTRHIARWFKVPKQQRELSRLVQNLSTLSDAMISPHVPFTRLHDLIAKILAAPAAMLADFKNWFYQFKIPTSWRPWFGALLSSRRGQLIAVHLIVLSMGLGISTYIAHSVATEIALMAAEMATEHATILSDAWVDNLIWLGTTADLERVKLTLETLQASLCFAWSAPPTIQPRTFDFLGISFSLDSRSARPSDAIRNKLLANTQLLDNGPSVRSTLAILGLLLWVNWAVARYPLAFFEAILGWLSATAAISENLDAPANIPLQVAQEIRALTAHTARARITLEELNAPFSVEVTLFSDASNTALAAVHLHDERPSVHIWDADPHMTIFAREALAFLLAVQVIRRPPRILGAGIDNMNWICALHKGHSSNPKINAILRAYYRYATRHGIRASTTFFPSQKQLADFPSRRQPLPSNWRDYFVPQTPLRPLPVFRVPDASPTDEEEEKGAVPSSTAVLHTQDF